MVQIRVIIPVKGPTEWVNRIVLSKTTNGDGVVTKLRVCPEARDLNKWAKREHNYTKTVYEVVAQLHMQSSSLSSMRRRGFGMSH